MQAPLRRDEDFAEWYVEDFMSTHLVQLYHSISAQGKREMVINGRKWARVYGFTDAEAQCHFVTFMWKIGAGFFLAPGFADIAAQTGQPDMARIDAFYNLPPEVAIGAIQNPDDRYWYPVENGLVTGGFE